MKTRTKVRILFSILGIFILFGFVIPFTMFILEEPLENWKFRSYRKEVMTFLSSENLGEIVSTGFYLKYVGRKRIGMTIRSDKKLTPLEAKNRLLYMTDKILYLANNDRTIRNYLGERVKQKDLTLLLKNFIFIGAYVRVSGDEYTKMHLCKFYGVGTVLGDLQFDFINEETGYIYDFTEEQLREWFPEVLK